MKRLSPGIAVLLLFLLVRLPGTGAEQVQVVTWNARLLDEEVDFDGFMEFARDAEVVVLQEVLGEEDLDDALDRAGVRGWHRAVSDFSKDSYRSPYSKLEVAILSPWPFSEVVEVDPYPRDDSEEMKARDRDLVVPDLLPGDQHGTVGARGWLWVRIPELRMVVAGVHLKSSSGRTGRADEENSFKREAVIAALGVTIRDDSRRNPGWTYVVAGDFNVAPGDTAKAGPDLTLRSDAPGEFRGYDQTHALLGAGLIPGLRMRNLTRDLPSSYAEGDFVDSPIDNIYALGPVFGPSTRPKAHRGATFGSDHHAITVLTE